MREISLTIKSENEAQLHLVDCNNGDKLFIRKEDQQLHLFTSWGESLGELPNFTEIELLKEYENGTGINAQITSIRGQDGDRSYDVEILTHSRIDDNGNIISIH